MNRWLLTLWRVLWGTQPETSDGYGQSLFDDVRSAARFRALAKQPLIWLSPTDYPGDVYADFPALERFGDRCFAYKRSEDEEWLIIDRCWHGWPDPPEFALLAFDSGKKIVTGYDFSDWPTAWIKPPETLNPPPSLTPAPQP